MSGEKVPDKAIIKQGEKVRELRIADFLALELNQQVNHLFRGEVEFFLGAEKLRTVDALKSLRKQRAEASQAAAAAYSR